MSLAEEYVKTMRAQYPDLYNYSAYFRASVNAFAELLPNLIDGIAVKAEKMDREMQVQMEAIQNSPPNIYMMSRNRKMGKVTTQRLLQEHQDHIHGLPISEQYSSFACPCGHLEEDFKKFVELEHDSPTCGIHISKGLGRG